MLWYIVAGRGGILKKFKISNLLTSSFKWTVFGGDIFCLLVHIFFLCVFKAFDITFMVYFNVGSIIFYSLLAIVILTKEAYTFSVCIALIEIIIHAIAATVSVGWNWGFAMFIVCIVPIPFMLEFKKRFMPYLISTIIVLAFLILKAYTTVEGSVMYSVDSQAASTAMYMFNSFFAFFLIIAISAVFKISRAESQQKLNDKNETLIRLAAIDPLTQLFNRRAMTSYMKTVQERAAATNTTYVVVMGDIDDFKRINDTYGHSCGDKVIETVARIMAECVPSEGYVCRWGGEEVLFAIPNCTSEKGTQVAEKIRSKIEAERFTSENGSYGVTITFGVYECDGRISYEKGISIADKYLYYGKQNGKNVVINHFADK